MTSFFRTHPHRIKNVRTRSRSGLAKFMFYAFLTVVLLHFVLTLRVHMNITDSNGNANDNSSETAFKISFISPSSSSSSSSLTITTSTDAQPKSTSIKNDVQVSSWEQHKEEEQNQELEKEQEHKHKQKNSKKQQVQDQGHLNNLITSTNNQLFQTVLKRDHGKGWEILRNDDKVTNNDTGITTESSNPLGYKCRWSEFQSISGNTAQMCVHNFFDFVSSSINQKKRWNDCDALPKLWNSTKTKTKITTASAKIDGNNDHDDDDNDDDDAADGGLYIEIGANIGACVMEMLLSTNANIIAFEPHPRNLFHLRSTISKLSPSMQNRVVIVPTALGEASATSKIYSAKNNMGNSVVGK
eukprot:857604_1